MDLYSYPLCPGMCGKLSLTLQSCAVLCRICVGSMAREICQIDLDLMSIALINIGFVHGQYQIDISFPW